MKNYTRQAAENFKKTDWWIAGVVAFVYEKRPIAQYRSSGCAVKAFQEIVVFCKFD